MRPRDGVLAVRVSEYMTIARLSTTLGPHLGAKLSYSTPHPARIYLIAAALRINHQCIVHCQARSVRWKKDFIESTRESDLCARLADYFGLTGHLAAQSPIQNLVDLDVKGPAIRAEVKYLRSSQAWTSIVNAREKGIKKDWDWLLACSSGNDEFKKRAWVVFWPSAASGMFSFQDCISLTKSHGNQFASSDFAPFAPLVDVGTTTGGTSHKLSFRNAPSRLSIIKMPGGKRVRLDLVGSTLNPVWCGVYTRVTLGEADALGLHATDIHEITEGPLPL